MRYYYLTLLTVVFDLSKLVIVIAVTVVTVVIVVVMVETAVKFVNSVTVEYLW